MAARSRGFGTTSQERSTAFGLEGARSLGGLVQQYGELSSNQLESATSHNDGQEPPPNSDVLPKS